jgi:dTDP-4-dehydrorhamnose 3,5-epimerase
MQIIQTGIDGLIEVVPKCFRDDRGWFMELSKNSALAQAGIPSDFMQDNLSYSVKGVVRGLHFQCAPHAQAKFVTVISGSVLDVVVDLRRDSATFLKTFCLELNSDKRNMLFIPAGFAHGFVAQKDSVFYYKCSNEYHGPSESGICWNDPTLAINWGVSNPIISDKDKELPELSTLLSSGLI